MVRGGLAKEVTLRDSTPSVASLGKQLGILARKCIGKWSGINSSEQREGDRTWQREKLSCDTTLGKAVKL